MRIFISVIKRLGRNTIALLIAGIPTILQQEPLYMAIAPILNAVGKLLREHFGLKNIPF